MKKPQLKILIVEDDEISGYLLRILLKKISREILYAENGLEAIEICKNNLDIDLIVMDIKMPLMGGYEATRKIREFNTKTIIIAQTAYALESDRNDAMAAGCNEYLSKPIKEAKILGLINQFF